MAGLVYTTHNAADVLEEVLKDLGLCVSFRIVSKLMLTRETYIAVQDAKEKIERMGIKQAFRLAGIQLLFSGPRKHIYKKICERLGIDGNTLRTSKFAKSKEHVCLDTTKIGKWNETYRRDGVYAFIETPFPAHDITSRQQTNFYMGVISAAMILAKKGDVETFVCGADWKNVFLTYELPALMVNKNIKNINGIPADDFRKIYYSGDEDAVYKTFHKICQSEIALTQQRMKSGNKHKQRLARRDYEAQSKFFELEQEDRKLEVKRGTFIGALRGVLATKSGGPAIVATPA